MAWLRTDDVSLAPGGRLLAEHVTFRVDPGDRIGLIGPNGMGKTSLFRLLRAEYLPEQGQVERSDDVVIASLDQLGRIADGTVWDIAFGSHLELPQMREAMRTLEARMADPDCDDLEHVLEEYAHIQERFIEADGYAWDARVRQTLMGAGIPESRFGDSPNTLSGGEHHRLALATVVLSGANLWLLDEPTNHLDIQAIEWLEDVLVHFPGAVVMASHDRRFLERTATRIMTWEDGFFWMVTGSYRRYLALRDERRQTTAQAWQRYQEERARLMAYVDRYRAGNRATQAKSRLHTIARLDAQAAKPAARTRTDPSRLAHRGQEMSGTHALVVNDLVLQREERTWLPLSFKLPAAARLGIVGPNGSGKTTLIRALVGTDAGVRWNQDAVVSWYDQEAAALLPSDETGLRLANDEGMDKETAFHLGARFGLTPDLLDTRTAPWSGGERSRLALLSAIMSRSTVLVLDEPTNHLDLPMREELEQLLTGYPGAVILVSHDRELVDNVATHMLWWAEGEFHFRPGRYSEVVGRA